MCYIVQIELYNVVLMITENYNVTMSMINRDIDLVTAEHTSTSSGNDGDSSEYLDDGYENPYTTLVVTDQAKDDHVYLTTKQNSDYENAISFQNIACGPACEFLEEDFLPDKINAQICDMNDLSGTNDSVSD